MPAGNPLRIPPPAENLQPLQPNSKAIHIRNKDGTKLITVPSRKVSNPEPSSINNSSSNAIAPSAPPPPPPPPPPAASQQSAPMDYSNSASSNNVGGKKKKKKRGKQNQQQQQGVVSNDHTGHNHNHTCDDPSHSHHGHTNNNHTNGPIPPPHQAHQYQQDIKDPMATFSGGETPEPDPEEYYSDQDFVDEDDEDSYTPPPQMHHSTTTPVAGKKKNKKKKKKAGNGGQENVYAATLLPTARNPIGTNVYRKGKDRIWNTSTNEERERIKDFWLSLGEDERRSLVKVEKEAVLRKMKEQQKHSCSCSVCGRKRTAIEEELEVLYDAYYEELEQYANQQQTSKYGQLPPSPAGGAYSISRIPPPPPPPGPPPGGHHVNHGSHHHHSSGRMEGGRVEEIDDDDFDEEDDDEYDDDEEVLDEPLPENDPRPDFFNFGNSLTVQGGILTVADDLLKNDGKKFIEMMEQLAERRMQREEEANAAASGHSPMALSMQQAHIAHNHSQQQQQEYDDEEYDDEEEDDEEEYDDEDEEEPDTMTEEQRMEEGRRMFQIFAARMFEQRVLTAYREKVAQERQRKLLEELEEENRLQEERELKKAKEKEKKKDKKRLQKQAKEEERLKKEAEKAEEEAKLRAIEEKRNEELRKKREEQKLKREAEKKAAEEEKHRKEEEKKKRLQEEREREAERDRKRKEHQERERKKREEAARKAREEKEQRDKEAKERREREERERREKEAKAKRDALERERIRREEEAKSRAEAAAATAAKRPPPVSVPAPAQASHPSVAYGSPRLSVATPAIPKQPIGPSPVRARNASQQGSMQGSVGSSPKTPQVVPRIGSSASPSTPILQHHMPGPIIPPNKAFQFPHIGPTSPLPYHIGPPPGVSAPDSGFPGASPIGMNGTSPLQPPFLAGFPQRQSLGGGMSMYPPPGQVPLGAHPQFRGYAAPNGIPMQVSAAAGMRPMQQQGRGMFMGDMTPGISSHQLPPGVPLIQPGSPFINRVEPIPISSMNSHSRAPSGSFEPIHRPAPIQRPSSVAPPKGADDHQNSVDELSKVMGSRALLDDAEEDPLDENLSPSRRASGVGFSPRPTRGLPGASLFPDPMGSNVFPSWGNPLPLGTISTSLPNTWANGAGWSETDAARSTYNRRRVSRLDKIRILTCKVCCEQGGLKNNFVDLLTLQRAVQNAASPELGFQFGELGEVLEVEGDPQNGGGNFKISHDPNGRTVVQYEPDEMGPDGNMHQGPVAPLGEIGSPIAGSAVPFRTPVVPPGMSVGSQGGF